MNRINKFLGSLGKGTRVALLSLAVIFAGAGFAQASTTIGTTILTGGTLGVLGVSTFGATASTTIGADGTLTTPATAKAIFLGGASTTLLTLLSGDTIKNASASSTAITGTLSVATSSTVDLTATGMSLLASTTATSFKVGQLGTQFAQVIDGYCVAAVTFPALTASSTSTYANCSTFNYSNVATSLLTPGTSHVFVLATSSLPSYIVLQSASTTAAGTINVQLTNFSTSTTVAAGSIYAFKFFAVQ